MPLTAEPAIWAGTTRVLGGIAVIETPLITRAMDYARLHSEPYLFNHAVRSWLFAVRLAQLQGVPHDPEVVAVGTLRHDLAHEQLHRSQTLRDRRSRRSPGVRPRAGSRRPP